MESASRPDGRSFSDWKGWVYNFAFFLNGLLIFLLLFEDRFVVPVWMQSLGRMHPLVLHFPLVVLMLYSIWILIVEKEESTKWNENLADTLLLIGTLTSVVAAFSGFVLSHEEGYEADALFWHKWLGIVISVCSIIWYSFKKYLPPWKLPAKLISVSLLIMLLIGGHLGGNLTHGEDFLTAPMQLASVENDKVTFEEANVYTDLVEPILEQKCISCHNAQKSKGDLQMQTKELFAKGGKEGTPWDTTKADLGVLLTRVHLPLDDKKHMPPRGKTPLTDEEIALLEAWIKGGSRFDLMVKSVDAQSPMYSYAQNVLAGSETEEKYEFSAASGDKIKELNSTYRLIKSVAAESPALAVNFYNRANFKSEDISALAPLKGQIIAMDLSKMPVKDEDLKTISQFVELRKLILNFTDITGSTLPELKKLTKLKNLSLSGTKVKLAQIQALSQIPSLKNVFVWNTELTPDEMITLKKSAKIRYETGFRGDTLVLNLNPPIIENESQILSANTDIRLKHQIPGTVLRYTIDGSEPDSTTSLVYSKPFPVTKNAKIKARAFKKGWYGSKTVEKFFFKSTFHADSARLITKADLKFPAQGAKTLYDGVKSDQSTSSGKWLGYRDLDFQTYLYFNKAVKAQSITLSMLRNVGGYIFPPARIEVWGGANEKQMKLLKVLTPEMPVKETSNSENLVFDFDFDMQEIGCFKIIAKPLSKLPPWHPGKGEKAWVFIDEVFVN
ncbi:FN3 associated domain-containing protein [Dyadobacter sp. LHD-138]|uniref:FN3 associated domain-containing protein n=1 Tax=Dyadobacter sp. LHD-138 TaxID=3071413 RepID=UPI0027E058F0|nr:FN3 associated domain-containing protein [Dyadobacter sp. LHD-138]MDQ6478780.1 FN3 associated domain-containing protein [Dyadobacter sp. LHD-138]